MAIYALVMGFTASTAPVHYSEYGSGTAVLALHGAGVDHREIAGALEPMFNTLAGYRRLYPDLPGMGRTPAPPTMTSNDDVVHALLGFVDNAVGTAPFIVIGHSYGGYLARAIAHLRPDQAIGMAVICPVGEKPQPAPPHLALVQAALPDGLDAEAEAGFLEYFVVQTPEMLRKYQERVLPSHGLADEESLARILSQWHIHLDNTAPYPHPVLILLGRQDSTSGFVGPSRLLDEYPRATLAVLDGVGHALLHEKPEAAWPLIEDFLRRARERSA